MDNHHTHIDIDWATQQVVGLERRLEALPEQAMQQAMLNELVDTYESAELVTVLYVLHNRAHHGNARARLALQVMALDPGVLVLLPYERLRESYQLAHEWGWPQVAGLFLSEPIRRPPNIDEAFTGNEHYDLPLGVRRQAARSSDRLILDRVLHDRNHRVVALLLDNPHIIERDVIAMSARRPTRPEVLEVIAAHRKWAVRYRIRKALAFNPYTPNTVARQLVTTLMANDLKELMDAGATPTKLKDIARQQLLSRPLPSSQNSTHQLDATISDSALKDELDAIHQSFSDETADRS